MEINRQEVKSTNLVSIGYDEQTETLEIEFKGNRIYRYQNVSKEEYNNLVNAESIGKYFNTNIKNEYMYEVK